MKLAVKIIEDANLSKSHFCRLVGVHHRILMRYLNYENLDEETNHKIATGLLTLKDSEIVWPDIHYIPNKGMEKQYKKNKKESERLDKKFATAYKKALKKAGL